MMDVSQIESVLEHVSAWCRKQSYLGYNKHDALNSPVLNALFGWGKWPRIIAIQCVMRAPVNIRPIFMTEKSYNPKGLALFVQANLDRYLATNEIQYLNEAENLLEKLVELRAEGSWHGKAWGYQYPWQDPGFYAAKGMPNAVVTSFVCESFLDAYSLTKKEIYLDVVSEVIPFFLKDLPVLKETDEEMCLGYMPVDMSMRVMDVSILIGTVLTRYASIIEDPKLAYIGKKLIRYVVNQQTDYNAWFYTDPPQDSHITHDNYHTGFILDALWRYMDVTDDKEWEPNYFKGLEFYAKNHFTKDGAPKWMHNKEYPYDIHGAAQGILTFARHKKEYPGFAMKIANWSIKNMYDSEGRFYYQQTRLYKKKFTLLRWCNGWMMRSLSNLVLEERKKIKHA